MGHSLSLALHLIGRHQMPAIWAASTHPEVVREVHDLEHAAAWVDHFHPVSENSQQE